MMYPFVFSNAFGECDVRMTKSGIFVNKIWCEPQRLYLENNFSPNKGGSQVNWCATKKCIA